MKKADVLTGSGVCALLAVLMGWGIMAYPRLVAGVYFIGAFAFAVWFVVTLFDKEAPHD